jgi:TPR repeat protein
VVSSAWKINADALDAEAQCRLGLAYRSGKGVAEDYAEAVRWYRKAAEQGTAVAQNDLGNACYDGQGWFVVNSSFFFLLLCPGWLW